MILVTGGTGGLGRAVVAQLLTRVEPSTVGVLARDPAKAADLAAQGVDVRIGDYDDATTLRAAMRDVQRLVLIASNQPDRRMDQHRAVIDAAVDAGVDLIGFSSRSLTDVNASRNALMRDYFETERLLQQSGLPALIFRNALYLDTLPRYFGGLAVLETGIRAPAGDSAVAYALRREMGEAMANAIIDAPAQSRTWVLAAPRASTLADVATGLSQASGQPVTYHDVSEDDFVAGAVGRGLPEAMARRTLGFFSDMRDGQLGEVSSDLTDLLKRPPAELSPALAEVFGIERSA